MSCMCRTPTAARRCWFIQGAEPHLYELRSTEPCTLRMKGEWRSGTYRFAERQGYRHGDVCTPAHDCAYSRPGVPSLQGCG